MSSTALATSKTTPRSEPWPEKKRLEAVQTYVLLGTIAQVAVTIGVPENTVKYWKQCQWWVDLEDELRRGSKLKLSAKLQETVNKAIEQVDDRIKNGDFVYNPQTKVYDRKPITAENANKIAAQMLDRSLVLEKAARSEKIDAASIKDRLDAIKKDLLKFVGGRTKPPEVIDAVVTVVQEELQAGELVQETAGSGEEAGGEEHSQEGSPEVGEGS